MSLTRTLAVPGVIALVVLLIPSALPAEQSTTSSHVLVGMIPNAGFEVTCDDSLVIEEPVVSDGLGIVGFTLDRSSLPESGTMCLRRPAAPDVTGCTIHSLDTTAQFNWTTDRLCYSHLDYGTSSGYLPYSSQESPSLMFDHEALLDPLDPETIYYYRMVSTDAFGNTSTTDVSSFETCPAGPAISDTDVVDVGTGSFKVRWMTSSMSTSRVDYGTVGMNGDGSVECGELKLDHELEVTGLEPGTTYQVSVTSVDECGCFDSVELGGVSTLTPADPVEITGVSVVEVTSTTATVRWWTTTPATSQVFYGETPLLGLQTALEPDLVTSHLAVIEGLEPATEHYFRVVSVDAFDQQAASDVLGFTTTDDGPQELNIYNVSVVVEDGPAATITWITNLPSTSLVEFGQDSDYGQYALCETPVIRHEVVLTNLSPQTVYHFSVTSSAEPDLIASSGDMMFSTHGVADLCPPTAPEGLVAIATNRAVELAWEASTAGDLGGYTVYRRREGQLLYEPLCQVPESETTHIDGDVVQGVFYDYAVTSRDEAGNESDLSSEVRAMAGATSAGGMWVYPNPLVEQTTIRFVPPGGGSGGSDYSLRIYDVAGRLVRTMDGRAGSSEPRTVHWDATDDGGSRVASGTYFCIVSNDAGVLRDKLLVLR